MNRSESSVTSLTTVAKSSTSTDAALIKKDLLKVTAKITVQCNTVGEKIISNNHNKNKNNIARKKAN